MYRRLTVLLLACLLVGCSSYSAKVEQIAGALSASDRSETDSARDAGRKPAEVLAFLGIKPGMSVIDLIAAGGWYTEVLSVAVGPSGKVYSQNPPAILKYRDGANDKALTKRLKGNRLPNVIRLDRDLDKLSLEPGSLDAALTALNFHDVIQLNGAEAAASFLTRVKELLKPGGVLGIIDHYGIDGQDNAKLHRLMVSGAWPIIEAAGFEVTMSDVLRNPNDDHTKGVFDAGMRGHTDRLLFRLMKPTGKSKHRGTGAPSIRLDEQLIPTIEPIIRSLPTTPTPTPPTPGP